MGSNGAATAAFALALSAVGFPSPTLFAALLVGLAFALVRARRTDVHRRVGASSPRRPSWGVTLGAYMQSEALRRGRARLAPGDAGQRGDARDQHGRRARPGSHDGAGGVPTATLGMIAGGASGIVTMADDLGGDDRLVAFMQYLRVLVVVLA